MTPSAKKKKRRLFCGSHTCWALSIQADCVYGKSVVITSMHSNRHWGMWLAIKRSDLNEVGIKGGMRVWLCFDCLGVMKCFVDLIHVVRIKSRIKSLDEIRCQNQTSALSSSVRESYVASFFVFCVLASCMLVVVVTVYLKLFSLIASLTDTNRLLYMHFRRLKWAMQDNLWKDWSIFGSRIRKGRWAP